MRKNNLSNPLLTVALCIAAMASLGSCASGEAAEEKAASFETMTIEKQNLELSFDIACKISGKHDVDILPEVSGTITRIAITEGQQVKAGQTLFVIDPKPFNLAYETAKASTATAKAQLATAELNYKSQQELFAKGVVSEFVLKTSENTFNSAKAALQMAQAQEASAANNLNHCTVKSPVNGVVGAIPFKIGSLVGPQMGAPLTTISDNRQVTASFSVDEKLYTQIYMECAKDPALNSQPFDSVQLRLKDGTIYSHKGAIVSFSGLVDATTGAVTGKAEFPNREGVLHSGISGSLIYPLTYDSVMVVPQTAVQQYLDKHMVYRVNSKGQAEGVIIDVQPVNDGKTYIVNQGLNVGDIIVSVGANNVHDGDQIVTK